MITAIYSARDAGSVEGRRARTLAVVERAGTSKEGPKDGIVAVKVQVGAAVFINFLNASP